MKKVDYILCGDNHLMEKKPVSRTDEFFPAMWKKLKFIDDLANKYNCPVLVSGDLLDHWKSSPELLTKIMQHLTAVWATIYGDHDLPQKAIENMDKSGLTTLQEAGKIKIIPGGHGSDKNNHKLPKDVAPSFITKGRKIFVWHILTWKKDLPFPDCKNKSAKQLLKRYPQFDLIVTGDNHKPFVEQYKGRLLVNVGSMMRIRADQIDYKPAVWLYSAKKNEVERVYLPIEKDVISREHIEVKEERDTRLTAFIEKVDSEVNGELDLETNLISFYQRNKTKKKVQNIITKSLENEKIA